LEEGDTMGERIGRIGRIQTDFGDLNARISSKKIKKIKKIRFNLPNPPNPFSHRIGIFQMRNCCNSLNDVAVLKQNFFNKIFVSVKIFMYICN
jgi:hypothetical protein